MMTFYFLTIWDDDISFFARRYCGSERAFGVNGIDAFAAGDRNKISFNVTDTIVIVATVHCDIVLPEPAWGFTMTNHSELVSYMVSKLAYLAQK